MRWDCRQEVGRRDLVRQGLRNHLVDHLEDHLGDLQDLPEDLRSHLGDRRGDRPEGLRDRGVADQEGPTQKTLAYGSSRSKSMRMTNIALLRWRLSRIARLLVWRLSRVAGLLLRRSTRLLILCTVG